MQLENKKYFEDHITLQVFKTVILLIYSDDTVYCRIAVWSEHILAWLRPPSPQNPHSSLQEVSHLQGK